MNLRGVIAKKKPMSMMVMTRLASTSGWQRRRYMTYRDIYDDKGNWIAVHGAVDSREPDDAALL